MPKIVTTSDFDKEVLQAEGLIMVDFWAEWCPPCRALSPILEQLDADHGEKVTVAKLNVDENPEISAKYGITGIPNVKFFKDGQVVEEIVGLAPKPHYEELINKHL
jgi:thioredoxin 1